MTQRRAWTEKEDKVLKYLKDTLQVKKWSEISRKMEFEFHLPGRNGKQCRQRYTNHLDSSIVSKQFTDEEQEKLFKLHDTIGNKWSIICKQFSGRTDNHIKNHFHSKLRKAIRKLNKQIKINFKKTVKPYKLSLIYKIVESSDYRFTSKLSFTQENLKFFNDLKNTLLQYAGGIIQKSDFSQLKAKQQTKQLISQLEQFEKFFKTKKSSQNSKTLIPSDLFEISVESKRNLSTSHSECGSDNDFDSEQKNEDSLLIYQSMSLQQYQHNQQNIISKNDQVDKTFSSKQNFNQKVGNKIQFDTTRVKTFYGFLNTQKLYDGEVLKKENVLFSLIEEKEFPFLELEKKISIQSQSLQEFEESCFLNQSQVSLMLKKFDQFSNFEQALFE